MRDLLAPALAVAAPGGVLNDAAVVEVPGARLAFTTDSFVVSPIRFPGGDIGELAVNGTLNDLAMMGATPVAISLAYVIEEGLPLEELRAITTSAAAAAAKAGARIVTGDTKVVGRGRRGPAVRQHRGHRPRAATAWRPSADRARPGDVVILSGPDRAPRRGDHERPRGPRVRGGDHVGHAGAQRPRGGDRSRWSRTSTSCATPPAAACRRRSTRSRGVRRGHGPRRAGASRSRARSARRASSWAWTRSTWPTRASWWRSCRPRPRTPCWPRCARRRRAPRPRVIGAVVADHPGMVTIRTIVGSERIVDMLVGEQLPRIC